MRNAKDTKHANPIQSMLTTKYSAYPIAVTKQGFKKYNVPEEFVRPNAHNKLLVE